jgi:SAM-dependent methyltransferase
MPGSIEGSATRDLPELPPEAFAKRDPTPDAVFYAQPRFVTHIDDAAIAAVSDLYRAVLPRDGVILDLMSSWVSHLPEEATYAAVIGHGLNARELAANARLARYFVQDLNADPALPLETASVDAVTICVSVQYLQQPVAVLREVARVLRPDAPAVVTFSNRCFPTKAVAIWGALGAGDHGPLVGLYLRRAGFARVEVRTVVPKGGAGDPLTAVIGWTAGQPVAVIAPPS